MRKDVLPARSRDPSCAARHRARVVLSERCDEQRRSLSLSSPTCSRRAESARRATTTTGASHPPPREKHAGLLLLRRPTGAQLARSRLSPSPLDPPSLTRHLCLRSQRAPWSSMTTDPAPAARARAGRAPSCCVAASIWRGRRGATHTAAAWVCGASLVARDTRKACSVRAR